MLRAPVVFGLCLSAAAFAWRPGIGPVLMVCVLLFLLLYERILYGKEQPMLTPYKFEPRPLPDFWQPWMGAHILDNETLEVLFDARFASETPDGEWATVEWVRAHPASPELLKLAEDAQAQARAVYPQVVRTGPKLPNFLRRMVG